MRRQNQYKILIYILAFCHLLAGCSDDLFTDDTGRGNGKKITLSGEIDQLAVTRVNDNGFADGDVMGVYIVDYNGNTPGTLQLNGNRADNVRHTFDEAAYKWNSAYDIYWKDDHTHVDIYGYYPFGSPESIDAYPFTVERDQSKPSEDGTMGGYEASDFLCYNGLPLRPEFRVFYDFDTRKPIFTANYWDYDYVYPHLHDATDKIVFEHERERIEGAFKSEKDRVQAMVETAMKRVTGLAGQWSVDILMDEGDNLWLIDMAIAQRSAYWEKRPEGYAE